MGGGFVWVDDRPAGTTNQEVIGFPTNPITVLQTTITPPHELPSYHSLDLYANASNANWTLRFYAKNVTDQRAYSQVTDLTSLSKMTSIVKGAPIQPRTLGFEVDYSF